MKEGYSPSAFDMTGQIKHCVGSCGVKLDSTLDNYVETFKNVIHCFFHLFIRTSFIIFLIFQNLKYKITVKMV